MSNHISNRLIYASGVHLDFSVDFASSVDKKSFLHIFICISHLRVSFSLFIPFGTLVFVFNGAIGLEGIFHRRCTVSLRIAYSFLSGKGIGRRGSDQLYPRDSKRRGSYAHGDP